MTELSARMRKSRREFILGLTVEGDSHAVESRIAIFDCLIAVGCVVLLDVILLLRLEGLVCFNLFCVFGVYDGLRLRPGVSSPWSAGR